MISILIRTKNEAAWIGRTLQAVLDQERADREILIVDSGSSDATLEIARRFPVRIIPLAPQPFRYGRALNVGAQEACGEWIVSLSAHAVPADRTWLARLVSPLEDRSIAGSSSRQRPHPGEQLEGYLYGWQRLYSLGLRTPLVERYLFSNASSAFRRDLWRRYPFNEKITHCEDHHWARQMQRMGYGIRYVPDSVVMHSHALPLGRRLGRGWRELIALREVYGLGGARGTRPRGTLRRLLRGVALIARYERRRTGRPSSATRLRTKGGTFFDLYQARAAARRAVVLIYGLTLEGERDPRLARFAEALRECGVSAVIPVLPGLKNLRLGTQDLEAVKDVLTTMRRRSGARVGIVAFSVGAALAMAAASAPALQDTVDRIVLIGPAWSVEELWDSFRGMCARGPATEKEWDHYIFARAALAYRCRGSLGMSEGDEQELVRVLRSFCLGTPIAEKKEFYERVLRPCENRALEAQAMEEDVVRNILSPDNLACVRSRVLILHDPFDYVVPPSHACRVYEILRQREIPEGQRLVLTSFLGHASERRGWGIADVPSGIEALDLVGEIFE